MAHFAISVMNALWVLLTELTPMTYCMLNFVDMGFAATFDGVKHRRTRYKAREIPKRPLLAVVGDAKVSTKFSVFGIPSHKWFRFN